LNLQQKTGLQKVTPGGEDTAESTPKDKNKLKPFISRKEIRNRVKKLAKKIDKDYKGKTPIFIGVLNGSFIFISDLVREVKVDIEIDFLKLSSYGDSKISSGDVKLLKDLNCSIEGRDIIVVEDIVDSGLSIKYIKDLILYHKPASLEFAALLYKKGTSRLDFDIKYIGFKIPDKFVVGYGLDHAQRYRNLKEIFILKN
jgi:hypoxanthine phosphoribosyltransferase